MPRVRGCRAPATGPPVRRVNQGLGRFGLRFESLMDDQIRVRVPQACHRFGEDYLVFLDDGLGQPAGRQPGPDPPGRGCGRQGPRSVHRRRGRPRWRRRTRPAVTPRIRPRRLRPRGGPCRAWAGRRRPGCQRRKQPARRCWSAVRRPSRCRSCVPRRRSMEASLEASMRTAPALPCRSWISTSTLGGLGMGAVLRLLQQFQPRFPDEPPSHWKSGAIQRSSTA